MASSEKIVSPGVFTNEIDQTFLPAGVGEIGAALIGPTVKGPAGIPTIVNSYSEYQQKFGDTFLSSSTYVSHLTAYTAREYLRHGSTLTVVRILAEGTQGTSTANSFVLTGSNATGADAHMSFTGSAVSDADTRTLPNVANSSFKLHTLSTGYLMNNQNPSASIELTGSNNILLSGSKNNVRWEVTSQNKSRGSFTLLIRRGDDSNKRKQTLETWNNVSLDPNSSNYISRIVGDQYYSLQGSGTTDPYLQLIGDYPNKSKYVRVEVIKQTPDYLDENGDIRIGAQSASLPGPGSGSHHGSFGGGTDGHIGYDALGNDVGDSDNSMGAQFYNNMFAQNMQGFDPGTSTDGKTAYEDAINLLGNQDEYDINLLMLPGLTDAASGTGASIISKAINMCEDRGDCFVIADPGLYGQPITTAATTAEARDSNYTSMYYPWVQIQDSNLGRSVWVPPSVVMGGVYAFNDRVAHPWFAPAGLNRGGIDSAVQVERKLTHANRDTLYDSNVNPIATFPGQGATVWGQKTLQKKASALDRINVRRLLIKLKKFIASTSKFLVFEQNTAATRRRFLNIVNPYMEQVQSNSGLTAFRVIMDETNNTPDTIDRNILYGQIFVQPARTAEFIVLDFTVQPTGATFPE